MKKAVELPIVKPLYSTYHYQGNGSAVLKNNKSIRNWYYNQVMNLQCTKGFLQGRTTPDIKIPLSFTVDNPYLDRHALPMKYLNGHVHPVIRALLDDGYYVAFHGIDDYYVSGKSWYKKKHFNHDGLICGYDQTDKTYRIFAYDQNWIYRVFKTPQKAFDNGRKAMFKQQQYGAICGLKPKNDPVELSPTDICTNLKEYLNSTFEKYPPEQDGVVNGCIVHDYIALYLDKLAEGYIPYERMDSRVFHLIWEHKTVMSQRIQAVESKLQLGHKMGDRYGQIVKEADNMRMLYASHHMKRRDALLPVIRQKLIAMKDQEETLLKNFIEDMEGAMKT